MHKRALGVLGVVAFAGLALPFGLPQVAQASGTIASISLMPFPIAQPGTLAPSTTVQICVQPRDANGATVGVGVPVWLSFFSGVFTAPLTSNQHRVCWGNSAGVDAGVEDDRRLMHLAKRHGVR